jgi:hypothetical protein
MVDVAERLHGGLYLAAGCQCCVSLLARFLHLRVAQGAGVQAVAEAGAQIVGGTSGLGVFDGRVMRTGR